MPWLWGKGESLGGTAACAKIPEHRESSKVNLGSWSGRKLVPKRNSSLSIQEYNRRNVDYIRSILHHIVSLAASILKLRMTSLGRPSMLRQLFISGPSARTLTARTLHTPLAIQLQKHQTPAIASKVSSFQPDCLCSNSPTLTRIAAFHVTSRKSILPALPRECLCFPLFQLAC